jgi:hypothetical protein
MNSIIFADYEPIHTLLKSHGQDPLTMNPFTLIQEKMAATGLNIIDTIVYGNFAKYLSGKEQTFLRSLGLQTRHIAGNGPNSCILELTIAALINLFENPNIEVFVIITNARISSRSSKSLNIKTNSPTSSPPKTAST